MAEPSARQWPWPISLALDISTGRHPLSAYIPPLLWLFDGVLTSLVVWKVPCKLRLSECSRKYLC